MKEISVWCTTSFSRNLLARMEPKGCSNTCVIKYDSTSSKRNYRLYLRIQISTPDTTCFRWGLFFVKVSKAFRKQGVSLLGFQRHKVQDSEWKDLGKHRGTWNAFPRGCERRFSLLHPPYRKLLFLTFGIHTNLQVKEPICHCIYLIRQHAATCILSPQDCQHSEFICFLLQQLLQSFHLLHLANYNVVTEPFAVLRDTQY